MVQALWCSLYHKTPPLGKEVEHHKPVTGNLPGVCRGVPEVHAIKGGPGINLKCMVENQGEKNHLIIPLSKMVWESQSRYWIGK